jgi:hypothetical protein
LVICLHTWSRCVRALRALRSRDESFAGPRSLLPASKHASSYISHRHRSQPLRLFIMADHTTCAAISDERISKAEDKAMDKQLPSNGHVEPGISIRMGPVDPMEVDEPATNGGANGKRKARSSITNGKSYKDASSSEEDDKPLVRLRLEHLLDSALTPPRASGGEHLSSQKSSRTSPIRSSATCL